MTFLSSFLASLLAIVIIECYNWLRRRTYHRALKQTVSLHHSSCLLIFPSIIDSRDGGTSIHYRDAYALSHVLAICYRLDINVDMTPFHMLSEIAEVTDQFVIGGPMANKITERYIRDYVPGYHAQKSNVEGQSTSGISKESKEKSAGFAIGAEFLSVDDDHDWALLIKLPGDLLDQNRTIHLLFGYSGEATGSVAYYLAKYYRHIAKTFGTSKYCIAVRIERGNYRNVKTTFRDLTQAAFADRAVQ